MLYTIQNVDTFVPLQIQYLKKLISESNVTLFTHLDSEQMVKISSLAKKLILNPIIENPLSVFKSNVFEMDVALFVSDDFCRKIFEEYLFSEILLKF